MWRMPAGLAGRLISWHDWPGLIARKMLKLPAGKYLPVAIEKGWRHLDRGLGRVTGPNEVNVGADVYRAAKILIAVGGTLQFTNIPGMKNHAISSNEALDLPEMPKKIVIYGSGYIALEFAVF